MTIKENHLYIGSFKASDLAKRYGTPVIIYDEEEIKKQIEAFIKYFKSNKYQTHIVYASKAYLSPYICQLIDDYQMEIDVVSLGDLYLVESSGFPLSKVLFHGNNKSLAELEYAVSHKVGIIVVDNYDELMTIMELAEKYQTVVNTMFRINPGIEASTHEYIQTSLLSSKFGESIFDEETIDKVMKLYEKNHLVHLLGFHAHIGSQIVSEKPFIASAKTLIEFTKKIQDQYNYKLSAVNLGGGFGIKYLDSDEECDLSHTLPKMIESIDELINEYELSISDIYIEPGRSIVGKAGFTLYQAGIIKRTYGGKNFLFVDGGMTDNIRPALYQAKYTVKIVDKMEDKPILKVDVVGKCCESGDIVSKDVMIPMVSKGDYVGVFVTGAYGYAMASNYNGALKPPVIFVSNDKIKVVSRKESVKDLMKLY